MIRSFKGKRGAQVFRREPCRDLAPEILRRAFRKLAYLHTTPDLESLRVPPGNRLEKLTGDRQGQYSIRINARWRICFVWRNGDAWEVEIVDYH